MSRERLYDLLPAFLREQDFAKGEPLRAFLGVFETQYRSLEGDIEALYDNWFIETCDEWVVPYIGDLLGIRGIDRARRLAVSQRSLVANTIRYRRSKGTASTLGATVSDASGWPVRVVEAFERVATTQNLRHLRPGRGGSADMRDPSIAYADTPLNSAARIVDLRGSVQKNECIPSRRYNINQLALFVWRLRSYPCQQRTARKIRSGCFTFHPFGADAPLFNQARTGAHDHSSLSDEGLPGPLSAAMLQAELESRRRGGISATNYFDVPSAFTIYVRWDSSVPLSIIDANQIQIMDLKDWQRPATAKAPVVAVDVDRGRLAFSIGSTPYEVQVSYASGFSGDIGGGPYDRRDSLALPQPQIWRATVSHEARNQASEKTNDQGIQRFYSLETAVKAWAETNRPGIIEICDNASYLLSTSRSAELSVTLEAGGELTIQAVNGVCPTIIGNLVITGRNGSMQMNGLMVDGRIQVDGSLKLEMYHCTLNPRSDGGSSAINIEASKGGAAQLDFTLSHCICGAIRLPASASSLTVRDCIIGAVNQEPHSTRQIGGDWPATFLERTTVYGPIHTSKLAASEVIFTRPLHVTQPGFGYLRFCYVPVESTTPQRYHCEPDLVLEHSSREEKSAVRRRIKPVFNSSIFGQPGYAQLARECPVEIRTGAEDGSEMGVFQHLHNPQREENMNEVAEDYTPVGLHTGAYTFVT